MAGNHFLLPYKVVDALSSGNLTGDESWQFIKAMVDYDRSGTLPDFPRGEASVIWAMIKPEIDHNKKTWEAELNRRSEAGKKGGSARSQAKVEAARENGRQGGAPPGNKNAVKTETTQTLIGLNAEKTTQAEYVNDSGNDLQKPQPIFLNIKNQCTAKGFFLDDDSAIENLISETDVSWFGDHSFVDFIAETVQETYGEKAKREQHKIFRKLLFDAPNLRAEYPQWRDLRKEKDATEERKGKRSKALAAVPKDCPICNGELNQSLQCKKHGRFEFSENVVKYVFLQYEPAEVNLSLAFRQHMKEKAV